MWPSVQRQLQENVSRSLRLQGQPESSYGGDSSDSQIVSAVNDETNENRQYFVKSNRDALKDMFDCEASGLNAIAATKTILTPNVIAVGAAASKAYIILDKLDFCSGSSSLWHRMGEQLARMHQHLSDQGHGWDHSNYIGTVKQHNRWTSSWLEFWREQRMRPQFDLAAKNGQPFDQAEEYLAKLSKILDQHEPSPSLLHGDLWSGNAGFANQQPVIYDPASYYGDRETDIAMTRLFGGFPRAFYDGYESAWPLPAGYKQRQQVYNLYHIVNHFNMFGGGYRAQAERIIADLCKL
eukprot:TRINITY_DN4667_c0_g1_i1.p2 TRINITY_DN4667_c0_g1~~TRINITY_DN4667_c0_g1_i1.p2  ORF type:complete len:295 (+),score=52.05 TRINITY_DN4667_c0_g1_i1:2038-2922(+)